MKKIVIVLSIITAIVSVAFMGLLGYMLGSKVDSSKVAMPLENDTHDPAIKATDDGDLSPESIVIEEPEKPEEPQKIDNIKEFPEEDFNNVNYLVYREETTGYSFIYPETFIDKTDWNVHPATIELVNKNNPEAKIFVYVRDYYNDVHIEGDTGNTDINKSLRELLEDGVITWSVQKDGMMAGKIRNDEVEIYRKVDNFDGNYSLRYIEFEYPVSQADEYDVLINMLVPSVTDTFLYANSEEHAEEDIPIDTQPESTTLYDNEIEELIKQSREYALQRNAALLSATNEKLADLYFKTEQYDKAYYALIVAAGVLTNDNTVRLPIIINGLKKHLYDAGDKERYLYYLEKLKSPSEFGKYADIIQEAIDEVE